MALLHTASETRHTIWKPVNKDKFVRTVQEVQKSSAQVPGDAHIHDREIDCAFNGSYQLPRAVEYQLAQDLAFIAAYEEGVHAVSAATVEETTAGQGLMITIASNSGVGPSIGESILGIGKNLEQCAQKDLPQSECAEIVFRSVVQLCEHRIVSRLKCKDWNAPAYYRKRPRPVHKDLEDLFDRYLSMGSYYTVQIEAQATRLQDFIKFMTKADGPNSTLAFQARLEALKLAGNVCGMQQSFELVLKQSGMKLDAASQKVIKAFDKVANYQHVSERLSRLAASSRFRHLFKSIHFRFLDSYAPRIVQGRERFVHAEIQIVTFHRLQRTHPLPRTIGTTKAACYLCDLFLSFHPQYTISATHGVIFHAWTIPDILSYSAEDREELRAIVQSMQEVLEARAGEKNRMFLPFPVQSGIYHVPSLPSLAETVIDYAPSIENAGVSTARTILRTQAAVAISSLESSGEAFTSPLSDCHAEPTPETASPKSCQQFETADEQYSKGEDSGLPEQANTLQGSEANEIGEYTLRNTKIKYDAEEDREVSEREETPNGGKCSSALEPTQKQADPIREPSGEANQKARSLSGKRSRRKRRRRRRRVGKPQNHQDNHGTSRPRRSSQSMTYRRSRRRGYIGQGKHKNYHSQRSKGRDSFLQSLWRMVRGTLRLFCG